jgi:epoxyqueuosine reductase QueG
MLMYEEPLFGFAQADDPCLASLNTIPETGLSMLLPKDWLPGAKTVISYFLPFTKTVRISNRGGDYPSPEWLNARIEGQSANEDLSRRLQSALIEAGYGAAVPVLDARFWSKTLGPEAGGPLYTSNWSERHVAYACGLGTFGLSKGLITAKGMAGRLGSVITTMVIPPTPRAYSGVYDYCTKCGVCASICPAGAISLEGGKEHVPCSRFLNTVKKENDGYYGCGKCQAGTPCESGIPPHRQKAAG